MANPIDKNLTIIVSKMLVLLEKRANFIQSLHHFGKSCRIKYICFFGDPVVGIARGQSLIMACTDTRLSYGSAKSYKEMYVRFWDFGANGLNAG